MKLGTNRLEGASPQLGNEAGCANEAGEGVCWVVPDGTMGSCGRGCSDPPSTAARFREVPTDTNMVANERASAGTQDAL